MKKLCVYSQALALMCVLSPMAMAGEGLGAVVTAKIRASGPQPQILSTTPADGSATTDAAPVFRVVFSIPMDTSRTQIERVLLPAGLTVTALVWIDATTLEIQFAGTLGTNFGAKRVDLADSYFISAGSRPIPISSGYAFCFTSPNVAPTLTAVATANPTTQIVGGNVAFAVSAADSDNDPLTYLWDLGDTNAGTTQNWTHQYAAPGNYAITVTVSDGKGGVALSQVFITIVEAGLGPQIVSTQPADGSDILTATPTLQVLFDQDMDTARTDVSKVVLPSGLTISQLVWTDARTLEIRYSGALPAFGAKHVDLLDGYFVNAQNAPIPLGSGYAFCYEDANGKPLIVFARPKPANSIARAGENVDFEGLAVDPDNDPLSYSWDFGDGSAAAPGQDASRVYAADGPYVVTLTVADGKGGIAIASFLLNGPGTEPRLAWTVTKAQIGLNFAKPGRDKISVAGLVTLAAGFNPASVRVTVDVGGVTQNFTLDPKGKGKGKTGKDTFSLRRKLVKKQFLGGAVKIQFKLAGTFAASLADEGFTNTTTPKTGSQVPVKMLLVIGSQAYEATPTTLYKAKASKTGKASFKSAIR